MLYDLRAMGLCILLAASAQTIACAQEPASRPSQRVTSTGASQDSASLATGQPRTTAHATKPDEFHRPLDKQQQLHAQSFWDNRDWDWYIQNIPFFECPDEDITTTYYYRWELLTKHLTYGSPNSGYSFTEFIDRRTARSDVPAERFVLLVERTVVAVRHDADAQSDGERSETSQNSRSGR